MKNIIIILSFLTLSSCMEDEQYIYKSYSLHITNYTDVPVEMSFYYNYDTSILNTYKIKAKESRYFDSVIFKITGGDYNRFDYQVVEGNNYYPFDYYHPEGPIWETRNIIQFKYGVLKQSILLKTIDIFDCTDTLRMNKPCNYYITTEKKTNIKNSPMKYISNYYITNQQFLLADSI